jgi:RNA polymerase-binding protein DksA
MKEDLDIKQLKQTLYERRAVLLSRVHVKSDASPSKALNPDRADLTQDYFLQERTSALRDRLEGTLEQVEAALQRLEDGSIGKCARCGEDISTARLEALPYAELCIACQKLLEKNT